MFQLSFYKVFPAGNQFLFSHNRRQTGRHQACLNARGAKEEGVANGAHRSFK